MGGRAEHAKKTRETLDKKMKEYPACVERFYNSMPNLSHNTKRIYVSTVIFFLNETGLKTDKDIYQVTEDDINNFCTKRSEEVAGASRLKEITVLTAFFNYLVDSGKIQKSPVNAERVRKGIKAEETETVTMSGEEIQKVFKEIGEKGGRWEKRDFLLFALPLSTGLRLSELDEIDVDDIDFKRKTLRIIGKGNRKGLINLSDDILLEISEWMKIREELIGEQKLNALFISRYGGCYNRMSVRTIERVVAKYTSFMDKKIRPHKLRSTFCTDAYRMCPDIYTVAELMRHKNIETTKRYIARDKELEKELAANVSTRLFSLTN